MAKLVILDHKTLTSDQESKAELVTEWKAKTETHFTTLHTTKIANQILEVGIIYVVDQGIFVVEGQATIG